MRIFLLIALLMFIFALIAALAGAIFSAGWNVWLCAGFISWLIDHLAAERT
jgi:hypothetical protein